jgi:hypothetical protein
MKRLRFEGRSFPNFFWIAVAAAPRKPSSIEASFFSIQRITSGFWRFWIRRHRSMRLRVAG